MSRNRLFLIFGLAAALLVILIIVFGFASKANRDYQASLPTPTPTSTPIPELVNIHCLGGQIYLNDEEILRILREDYRLEVKAESMGSFEMVAPETSYDGVDCVWTGSKAAYETLLVNHPGVEKAHETVFVTFLMNFTWKPYLESALNAGLVDKVGNAYTMDMLPIGKAFLADKTWADLGAKEIPGYVSGFRFSAPESSGGGLSSLYLLGAYLTPRDPGTPPRAIRDSDLNTMLPQLKIIWDAAGQQADSSPENWDEFRTKGYPWAISSESLFLGYLMKLTPEQQKNVTDQIIGVYPIYTMSTDHILVCISDACLKMLDAFKKDTRLQQIGWDNYGMRLGFGGVGAKPGDTDIPWILPNPQFIPDPKQSVTDIVKPALK